MLVVGQLIKIIDRTSKVKKTPYKELHVLENLDQDFTPSLQKISYFGKSNGHKVGEKVQLNVAVNLYKDNGGVPRMSLASF